MTAHDLEDLRRFCRNDAAFEQLKQVLAQGPVQPTPPAPVAHQTQALESQRQAAEAASQAKSRFLAMMSHELRTPLNSILGLSALLSRQVVGDLNPKQLEYLNYIHGSGEHLLAIISDILDLSRVEAGQEHLRLAEVSLPELCQSCLAMVQPRASEKTLALTHHIAPDALTCIADERRLRQMLLNLLSNAVKFTPEGRVTLTVRHCGELLEFQVEDTGIGMPPDQLDQIFQPFTQIDRDLNRQFDGAGLGLTLTRQLAQLHGGYLRVESTVGQGSHFFLYLPRHSLPRQGVETKPAPQATPRSPEEGQRLVMIDSNLDRHQTLLAYVRACGWQASSYQTWPEVLMYLRRQPQHLLPHLLIVGDREADNPDLPLHLQQLRPPLMPQPIKVAILYGESAPELAAAADTTIDCIPLPLTAPKLERMLSP